MKKLLFTTLLTILAFNNIMACECECFGDCSFKEVSSNSGFVALVKIISHDDFIEEEIPGYNDKMPRSMTVEIIKKYKGSELRDTIKIWGDDGAQCRPYIAYFNVGEYYLIAPNKLGSAHLNGENENDYDFFSCSTDYLKVDFNKKIAIGQYSKRKKQISLEKFRKSLISD